MWCPRHYGCYSITSSSAEPHTLHNRNTNNIKFKQMDATVVVYELPCMDELVLINVQLSIFHFTLTSSFLCNHINSFLSMGKKISKT